MILVCYVKMGVIDYFVCYGVSYGDFLVVDFFMVMQIIVQVQSMFNDLLSVICERFDNDFVVFFEFVQDFVNVDEMVEMGLFDQLVLDWVLDGLGYFFCRFFGCGNVDNWV